MIEAKHFNAFAEQLAFIKNKNVRSIQSMIKILTCREPIKSTFRGLHAGLDRQAVYAVDLCGYNDLQFYYVSYRFRFRHHQFANIANGTNPCYKSMHSTNK